MEGDGDGNDFLEALLALRQETWEPLNPLENDEDQMFSSNGFRFQTLDRHGNTPPVDYHSSSSNDTFFNDVCVPFLEELSAPFFPDSSHYSAVDASLDETPPPPPPSGARPEFPPAVLEEEGPTCFPGGELCREESLWNWKMESLQESPETPGFKFGACAERKTRRSEKSRGEPSKNLMAERRRRKRLNDRLSMLRAIVPKLSKVLHGSFHVC